MFTLKRNQAQKIAFVMIDTAGVEIPALLPADLSIAVSKDGAAFTAGAGTAGVIGAGWYAYTLTAAETDTPGALAVRVTAPGAQQQNLLYTVETVVTNQIAFTYTLTEDPGGAPIIGADVWFTTDAGGVYIVWAGKTDAFGVARDREGGLPLLNPGVYRVWRSRIGYTFQNPDVEEVN